jgi:hypothetical protein
MPERSSDYSLELEDAIVRDDVDEEDVTPARFRARKPRKTSNSGGIWIPVQIVARMKGATADEWAMVNCLCRLEFKAFKKCQPLVLTRKAMAEFGITRWTYEQALSQLTARGILTVARTSRAAPRVTVTSNLWG